MQFEQQVDVSPAQFYMNLLQVFKKEYAYYTNQTDISLEELDIQPGVHYDVQNEKRSYRVKLEALVPNEQYISVVSSSRGTTRVMYEIRSGDRENKAWITYTEVTQGGGFFQKLNETIIGFFFKKKIMQGMQEKIEQIAHFS